MTQDTTPPQPPELDSLDAAAAQEQTQPPLPDVMHIDTVDKFFALLGEL